MPAAARLAARADDRRDREAHRHDHSRSRAHGDDARVPPRGPVPRRRGRAPTAHARLDASTSREGGVPEAKRSHARAPGRAWRAAGSRRGGAGWWSVKRGTGGVRNGASTSFCRDWRGPTCGRRRGAWTFNRTTRRGTVRLPSASGRVAGRSSGVHSFGRDPVWPEASGCTGRRRERRRTIAARGPGALRPVPRSSPVRRPPPARARTRRHHRGGSVEIASAEPFDSTRAVAARSDGRVSGRSGRRGDVVEYIRGAWACRNPSRPLPASWDDRTGRR